MRLMVPALVLTVAATLARGKEPPRATETPDRHAGAANSRTLAFRDVTVLPMDSDRVLPHTTVLVSGDRITTVAPDSSVTLPAGARVIAGHGRFLMPGLADMHVHVDRVEMLPMFLAQGVTTTLNMGLAAPAFVTQTRLELKRGSVVGPTVYAALMLDGPGDPGPPPSIAAPPEVVTCEAEARAAVDRAKLVGYEFIKVYGRLAPDVYAAALDEAERQHIAVVGHVPTAVGYEKAVVSGQVMIAHAEEIYKTFFQDEPDTSRIAPAVELTRRAGVWVTPNLSFFAFLSAATANPSAFDAAMRRPGARRMPPDIVAGWLERRPSQPSDQFVAELQVLRALTHALAEAGVPLLAGTDTPIAGMVPGASLVEDLEQMVDAGLTPFQALSAATAAPGRFIRAYVPDADGFGTIAPGMRADLLMVAASPLDDVRNVEHPLVVMVRGRLFESRELQAMVEHAAAAYMPVSAAETAFRHDVAVLGAVECVRRSRQHPSRAPLPESFLNALGYQALHAHDVGGAIALFRLNAERHADSWNVYNSLGEAYAAAGEREAAVVNYRHSLAINPRNVDAMRALQDGRGAR